MKKESVLPDSTEMQLPLTDVEIPHPENSNRLQNLFEKKVPDFTESTGFHRGSRSGGRGYQLVAWSLIAATIDSLILFSISCFFLFGLSLLVKFQANSILHQLGGSLFQVGLIAAVFWIVTYMIMLRVFLGFTVGEWACGLRLGSLQQRLSRHYSLKVLARVLLIAGTGLVLFPILSLLTGRDLPGILLKLPLIQLAPVKT